MTDMPSDDPKQQLDRVVDMMRAVSMQSDPQAMVREYSTRMAQVSPTDRGISISRRNLESPRVRVTRASIWDDSINPWKEKDKLPVYDTGLLSELIYGDVPVIIDDLKVRSDDPAAQLLEGMGSLAAVPVYDEGVALNMVVFLRRGKNAFDHTQLADMVHRSNLFGRATKSLVLTAELREVYAEMQRDMTVVAEIQRSLLPPKFPDIPTIELAAHYEMATDAGGDYYDFFNLGQGRWGIFIGDVCGHGAPAAVLMAITHCLAHTLPHCSACPGELLAYVNNHLADRYTNGGGKFVTAFYGVYDVNDRSLTYASAGHNPPRVKRCNDGTLFNLDAVGDVPLGIMPDVRYETETVKLVPGDQIVFYTDGIVEARNYAGDDMGVDRLDAVLENCSIDAHALIRQVLDALNTFCDGYPADDDRTLLVAKIR